MTSRCYTDSRRFRFHSRSREGRLIAVATISNASAVELAPNAATVLHLPATRNAVDRCLAAVRDDPRLRVCLISTFAVHFGDRRAEQIEAAMRDEFRRTARGRCTVLRVGNALRPRSSYGTFARCLAAFYPLLSPAFRSCFVEEHEVADAVRDLTDPNAPFGERTVTLLGENRPYRDVWRERAANDRVGRSLTAAAVVLQWLLIGRVFALLYRIVARRRPAWRRRMCHTLEPQSFSELLALYNPWNRRHIVLAGYNTGVDHFGWNFPGRTIVKTTGCANRVRIRECGDIDVDAGTTIKRVVTELDGVERQLYVVPNYSYVAMGTAFFVPIHGSGGEVSTLGDTIEKVVLYDPTRDRIVSVRYDDPDFVQTMYAAHSGMLALRLRFRTRPQSRYFMSRYVVESPTAADVWRLFDERGASNIELRKASAASSALQVSKFYQGDDESDELLEIPRDSIGRLWDRLEENRLTSALFHGLVRRYAFHVELFLDREEFEVFWREHVRLPLKKLQFRFVHRDGMPNSPFGRRDCISVDLFMSRAVRSEFLAFIKDKLPYARFNRGKHGM